MKTKRILTTAALAGIIGLAATQAAQAEQAASEKCYGVVKAGKNDCGANGHSCAGHAAKDGDATEWVMVPAGLCEKLANGSLTPPTTAPAEEHKMEEHKMEEKH